MAAGLRALDAAALAALPAALAELADEAGAGDTAWGGATGDSVPDGSAAPEAPSTEEAGAGSTYTGCGLAGFLP
jgi:hypothetical protein